MRLFVVYKEGEPAFPKSGKKQPKVYTDDKNAIIAIKNMLPSHELFTRNLTQEEYNKEMARYEIVEYVPKRNK